MLNLVSMAGLAGIPPQVPLMTDTIHTFGWLLVVSLVVGSGLTLAGSVVRDAMSRVSTGGPKARRNSSELCSSCA